MRFGNHHQRCVFPVTLRAYALRAAFIFVLIATSAFAADGKLLLEQGRFRQLYGVAKDRLSHNAHDAEALSWMSAIYDAQGDFDTALDFLAAPPRPRPSAARRTVSLPMCSAIRR